MRRLLLLAILIQLFLPATTAADSPGEPVKPLPRFTEDRIRLGEGRPYCAAGYGTQQLVFRIGDDTFRDDAVSSPYLPSVNPIMATFLKFGCRTDRVHVDVSMVIDSMRMDGIARSNGVDYNTIEYQLRMLSLGHSVSLMPHRLYLDLGLTYVQLDYRMGLYGRRYSREYRSERLADDHFMVGTSLRFLVNHYLMIHWRHDKAFDDDALVDYSGQFGLNFMSRF